VKVEKQGESLFEFIMGENIILVRKFREAS